jgi:TonB family protein
MEAARAPGRVLAPGPELAPASGLQGLGSGLDQRAIDAVRQWRFNPARRYGTPVDVMVEIAVEFRLR